VTLDQRFVSTLNGWGLRNTFLVAICSEYLVFFVSLIAVSWFANNIYQRHRPINSIRVMLSDLVLSTFVLFVIPVGLATLISELMSQIYVRQRPFVTMSNVQLLVPHNADGGMPSHHMVFMMSISTLVYLSNKRFGVLLIFLSVISGIARVSAGIHYPSDVVAGILLGSLVSIAFIQISLRLFDNRFSNFLRS